MSEPIDISLTVRPGIPVWPGSPDVTFEPRLAIAHGDEANDTTLRFSAHTGTHVDAPSHFVESAGTVDQLSLQTLIGPAQVVEVPSLKVIDAAALQGLEIPANTQRLLFKTTNSQLWETGDQGFHTDFTALSADGAQWVVDHGVQLVGIDYLSIQRYEDPPDTHLILLRAGVIILEGLNLTAVSPGRYGLCCLPLKLRGVEAAPARAVLLPAEAMA